MTARYVMTGVTSLHVMAGLTAIEVMAEFDVFHMMARLASATDMMLAGVLSARGMSFLFVAAIGWEGQ